MPEYQGERVFLPFINGFRVMLRVVELEWIITVIFSTDPTYPTTWVLSFLSWTRLPKKTICDIQFFVPDRRKCAEKTESFVFSLFPLIFFFYSTSEIFRSSTWKIIQRKRRLMHQQDAHRDRTTTSQSPDSILGVDRIMVFFPWPTDEPDE